MAEPLVLAVNPGAGSTKLALFRGPRPEQTARLEHPELTARPLGRVWDERPARLAAVRAFLAAAGVGPGDLVRARLGQRVALLAQGAWRWLPEAAPRETFGVDLAARLHLSRGLSLALEARRRPEEAALGLTLYAYDWL